MKKNNPITVTAESTRTSPAYSGTVATERPKPKRGVSLAAKSPPLSSRKPSGDGGSNGHASELDAEQILAALMAFKKGDFSTRLPVGWTGVAGKVADTFNEVAELMSHQTEELSRISRVVGKEGRIQERLSVGHVGGAWSERVDSVNNLIDC